MPGADPPGGRAAGWAMDHVIAEVWDGRRWRLVEPTVAAGHLDPTDGTVLDVPRDQFRTGPKPVGRRPG